MQVSRAVRYGVIAATFGTGFAVLTASAHVGFGEYAGTHAVSLVAEPRSPFVNETVQMTFYLRDLHGSLTTEPFVTLVTIQEILADGEERGIFGTPTAIITNGIYKMSYVFKKAGHYRLDFTFWRSNETDITRDGVFDIEVRKRPSRSTPINLLVLLTAFSVGLAAGFGMRKRLS